MKDYIYLKTEVGEPIVSGSNSSGLAQPFLQFYRGVERPNGQLIITIRVDFTSEGLGSDFRFNVVSKSLFEVKDASNIVVHDVYDMDRKAIEELRAFLDYKIGKDGVSTIGVPMPPMGAVLSELVDFVTRLHSGA
jgi:hypothetical protein